MVVVVVVVVIGKSDRLDMIRVAAVRKDIWKRRDKKKRRGRESGFYSKVPSVTSQCGMI